MSKATTCDGCGKSLEGKRNAFTTVSDSWMKAGGRGEPPQDAILAVCSNACLTKANNKAAKWVPLQGSGRYA